MPDLVDEQERHMRSTLKDRFPTFQSIMSLALGQEDSERRKLTVELVNKTFRYIGDLMTDGDNCPTMIYLIDAWSVTLPAEHRDMLEEREPVALVVLAHYAVLISLTPEVWHLNGWPALLINRIAAVLGKEWVEFLRWPQDMISGDKFETAGASASPKPRSRHLIYVLRSA
jgi:hypothetical protein